MITNFFFFIKVASLKNSKQYVNKIDFEGIVSVARVWELTGATSFFHVTYSWA